MEPVSFTYKVLSTVPGMQYMLMVAIYPLMMVPWGLVLKYSTVSVGVRKPRFEPGLASYTLCDLEHVVEPLGASFLICKMATMIVLISTVCWPLNEMAEWNVDLAVYKRDGQVCASH